MLRPAAGDEPEPWEDVMIANNISPCIATDDMEKSKNFYIKYFGAKVVFDCGWYVTLRCGRDSSTLHFMTPQKPGEPLCAGEGLTYNFAVENVDEEYENLTGMGLEAVMPLEDHPWGDRGFGVRDPHGILLYIYSERTPSEEFRQYYVEEPDIAL